MAGDRTRTPSECASCAGVQRISCAPRARRAIAREIGHRQGEAIASWNLGLSYEQLGESERAIAAMQVRVDYERAINHPDAEETAAHVEAIHCRPKEGSLRSRTTEEEAP